MTSDKVVFTCVASLATLVVGYIGYAVITAKKYVPRSKISKLVIYPIKSLPGIQVDHLDILPSFCRYKNFLDRSWVLIDEVNRMITLRTEPSLYKIKMTLLEDEILLEADNMRSIRIPNVQALKKGDLIHTTNIWNQEIDGQDCGASINNWFSEFLGKKVKLIKHHPQFGYRATKTIVNDELVKTNGKNLDILYQDGAPLLIMNEKSVQDLNERIQEEHANENLAYIEALRFRPNIFFETDRPYEEDTWKFMKIGCAEFEFLVECGRCKLTTLNIETLQYESEPLRTLKKFREGPYKIFAGAPKLGCYFKPIKTGRINVGDEIKASF